MPPDVIVIGSGAAALSAALAASVGGASVLILEKSEKVGGTSAMSGGGTWIPVNHHARAAGIADSPEEVLTYLRAASAPGWAEREEPLWRSFVENAPEMLEFVERHTPLRFALVEEPDPQAEKPGGKTRGRMLSPRPLSRPLVVEVLLRVEEILFEVLLVLLVRFDANLHLRHHDDRLHGLKPNSSPPHCPHRARQKRCCPWCDRHGSAYRRENAPACWWSWRFRTGSPARPMGSWHRRQAHSL